jgi:predicted dehydrogenase
MLNVALLGIGNIGLLYDKDFKDTSKILSHIKAIYLHKEFTLKYVVDVDTSHLDTVKEVFPKVIFYKDYKKLINKKDIDILVIATPTNTHFSILNSFDKNIHIKSFFIEKPLFLNNLEYTHLSKNLKNKIFVNYLRRFDSNIIKLKKQIHNNKFGTIQKIVINYCKGIKNNGSHMIDMINFLFENPRIISSKILSDTKGFNNEDLTYDIFIQIKYKKQIIPLYFLGLDHTLYNIIEQNIYFENKIIKYINSKSAIEYFDIVPDKNFDQYKISSHIPKVKEVKTTTLMKEAYSTLHKTLVKNKKNHSSYYDELANQEFFETIIKDK